MKKEKDKEFVELKARCVQYTLEEKTKGEFSIEHQGITFGYQISGNEFDSGVEFLVSENIISDRKFSNVEDPKKVIIDKDAIVELMAVLTKHFRSSKHPSSLTEFQATCEAVLIKHSYGSENFRMIGKSKKDGSKP